MLVALSVITGCAGRAPDASPDRSPAVSAPRPAIHLGERDSLVPGGPPLPFRVSVEGRLTDAQAAQRVLGLYTGLTPDRLQVREDGAWHDVPLQWTNEQDDNGEFVAVLPLAHHGKARRAFDFRLFTADRERGSGEGPTSTVAAQLARKGWTPSAHAAASAPRLRLPIDPTHLAIEAPDVLRATEGGPPVEWKVRVRNAAGKLTRSGLRIAITLGPGAAGQSVSGLPWSVEDQGDRGDKGRWTDLTGRTHIETDEFALAPGQSRTVRVRLALPRAAPGYSEVGAVLSAAVTAPWWPSDPEEPSGVSSGAESTNVLVER
ncbi:hypothetical protein [Streptomyces viridochromogenes]|uniref:hypothetical protein n=1 Tax=Streptomyces viridochromogenes TaxID=1938 RepID=UPI0001B51C72|nr:hypothetical protein [Streptomyces viridochromogenes]